MKQILLFGAGKSATVLIKYLLRNAVAQDWQLTVVDADPETARKKIGSAIRGKAVSFDIKDDLQRGQFIQAADLVISLLPPALHILVAQDCLAQGKHLLTASYRDEEMKALGEEIREKNLLFLCEMGLDPGIDHMSAKKIIDEIHADGGKVLSFLSHCGGLVAPENDDNPWHYKISWNPRNIVNAGKAGALFLQEGQIREMNYPELFAERRLVAMPGGEAWCWYPNRDSLSYIPLYDLQTAHTFIRTTLRHPDFMYGWKNLVDLRLTADEPIRDTTGLSLANYFKEHLNNQGFSEWLEQKLQEQFDSTKGLLTQLVNLVELEQKAAEKGLEKPEEFMVVDDSGELQEIDIDDLKINAAATLADKVHDASLTLKQLFHLGMDDEQTTIDKGLCSPADVLQLVLEKKLPLQAHDRDMILMLHEIEFEKDGKLFKTTSALTVKGEDDQHTAMAATVGLPLGIAARLILDGTLNLRGLHIPVLPAIYEPLLKELEKEGISFEERTVEISKS